MRVLFLNHNVRGRGTWVRAFHLGRELVNTGHDVTVVTTSPHSRVHVHEETSDGVRVIEMPDLWWGPARTGWDPYNTLRRIRRLRDARYDLVHAFDSRPAVVLPALRVADATGAPLVMDWADWWGRGGRIQERSGWPVRTFFGPIETWFEEAFRLRAAAATVICSALEDRLAALGFPGERILRLPNGSPRLELPTRAAARDALDVAADEKLLLHVGVIMADDRALLLDAFSRARALEPRLRLVFVGSTGAAGDGVVSTGFVSAGELQQWLAAADAGVVPMHDTTGHRGRWPAKASDYMAAGLPTIITDVGDMAAVVRERAIGWVSAPEPVALARAIGEAVNASDREARGQRARTIANGDLSWRSVAARLDSFYGGVMDEWRKVA
ncbi:MAG: glycosyltransferase [Longimicrobiales bacterium]